jgi:hypothetical protein
MKILIECARPMPDAAAIRRAAEEVRDWDLVLAQAGRHGMLPLIYWRLGRGDAGLLPPDVWARVAERFHSVTRRNLMMAAELRSVMGWLESAGVEAIAFKGPTLAALVYENLGLRECGDLDILVRPADRARALAVLSAHGCVEKGAEGAGTLRGNCEVVVRTPGACDVDLHWSVLPPYFLRFDARYAWGRAQRVALAGTSVPTFGRDDLFAVLALHGARHCWSSLTLVGDVANLIQLAPPRWEALLSERSTRRAYHLAALLAADLLQARVPPGVLESARRDRRVVSMAAEVGRRLFAGPDGVAASPHEARLHLGVAVAWGDKLRYLWARAAQPNQTDNDFLPLPPRLRRLLWVVRPIRLVTKLASRAAAGRRPAA